MLLYEAKETEFPEIEQFRELERVVLLKVIDRKWMDHIDDMDQLRQGIGLQAYGQRDPLVEYKMAGFDMFDEMIAGIQEDTIRLLYHVQVEQKVEREQVAKVTGTNKDESAAKHRRSVNMPRYIRMIRVHVAVVRNISSAADVRLYKIEADNKNVETIMVSAFFCNDTIFVSLEI